MPDRGHSRPKGTEAENCSGGKRRCREAWGEELEARIVSSPGCPTVKLTRFRGASGRVQKALGGGCWRPGLGLGASRGKL